jgi:beta-glucosidase-like glycosyl hydrolase
VHCENLLVLLNEGHCDQIAQAVAAGLVNQSTIDAAVSRVLAHKFSAGLFDAPFVNASAACEVVNSPEHRALARVGSWALFFFCSTCLPAPT